MAFKAFLDDSTGFNYDVLHFCSTMWALQINELKEAEASLAKARDDQLSEVAAEAGKAEDKEEDGQATPMSVEHTAIMHTVVDCMERFLHYLQEQGQHEV